MADTSSSSYHLQEEPVDAPRLSEPRSVQPSPANSVLRERQHANLPPRPPLPTKQRQNVVKASNSNTNDENKNTMNSGKSLLTLLPPSEKAKVGQLIKQLVKEKTEKENVKQELSALTVKFEGKVANLRENNIKMREETEHLKKKFSQSLGMIQAYQNELLLRDQSERSMDVSNDYQSPNTRRRSGSVSLRSGGRGKGKKFRGARTRTRSWAGRGSKVHNNSSNHGDCEQEDETVDLVDSSCQVDEPPELVDVSVKSSPERQKHAEVHIVEAESKQEEPEKSKEENVGIEQVADALTSEQFSLLQKYMKLQGQEIKLPAKFESKDEKVVEIKQKEEEKIEEPKSEPAPMPQQQSPQPPAQPQQVVAVPMQVNGEVQWVPCVTNQQLESSSVLVPVSPALSPAPQQQSSPQQEEEKVATRSVSPAKRSPKKGLNAAPKAPFKVPPANINSTNDTLIKVGKSRWVDPPSPKTQQSKPKSSARGKNQVWVAKKRMDVPVPKRRPPQPKKAGPKLVQYRPEVHRPTVHRPPTHTNQMNNHVNLNDTQEFDDLTLVGSPGAPAQNAMQKGRVGGLREGAAAVGQRFGMREPQPESQAPPPPPPAPPINPMHARGPRMQNQDVPNHMLRLPTPPNGGDVRQAERIPRHVTTASPDIRRPRPQQPTYTSASSNVPYSPVIQEEYEEVSSYMDSPQVRPRRRFNNNQQQHPDVSYDDVPATPDFPHQVESSWSPPPPPAQIQSTASSDVGPLLAALEPQLRNNPEFQQSLEDGLRMMQSQANQSCFSFCHNGDGPPTFGKGFTDSLSSSAQFKSHDRYDRYQSQQATPEFPSSSYTTPEPPRVLPQPIHNLDNDEPYYRKSIINLISTYFFINFVIKYLHDFVVFDLKIYQQKNVCKK